MAADRHDPTLSDIAADVRELRREVLEHGNMLGLMMYSQATAFADKVIEELASDSVLLEVFLRIDGVSTKDAVCKAVVALRLPNGARSSVYSRFQKLQNLGLIEPVAAVGSSAVFRKSTIANNLRIEHDPRYVKALKARG